MFICPVPVQAGEDFGERITQRVAYGNRQPPAGKYGPVGHQGHGFVSQIAPGALQPLGSFWIQPQPERPVRQQVAGIEAGPGGSGNPVQPQTAMGNRKEKTTMSTGAPKPSRKPRRRPMDAMKKKAKDKGFDFGKAIRRGFGRV